MSKKTKEWCKNVSKHLEVVGAMDTTNEVELCEDYILNWLFSEGLEPLIRSIIHKRFSTYELSKALTLVLETQLKPPNIR